MGPQARISRARNPPGGQRAVDAPGSRAAGWSPRDSMLALQRFAGNRAVGQVLARRVVGNDPATRVVKLEVGFELTEKLARAAWTLTAKGPLDEAGVESLRQIALEHYFGTIDDDERLLIAALLDAGNASKLHEQYPRGFSESGSVIEFSAASITETNRRIVRDSGRSVRLEPTESDKAFIKDPLDQDIVAMTGPFRIVAMQTLKLADKAGIDHVKVYFAMLNGASDSTPGDRAYAGAAYVIASSERMDVANEILAQRLKIDEVSSAWFDAEGEGSHAEFVPESSGQRKGDTIYVPATFDLDNVDHVSTMVHELQHAGDAAAAAANPRDFSRVELEETAYERQSRYMLAQLEQRTGGAQTTAEQQVAERIGPTHIYLMIVAALETTGSADDQLWHELVTIISDVNDRAQAFEPGSGLEPGDFSAALNATASQNREKARDGIRLDNKRYKRTPTVRLGGLKGESRLDRTPAGADPTAAASVRTASPARTLARDPDLNLQGKTIEDEQVAKDAAAETALQALAAKAKDPAKVRELLLKMVATYVPETWTKLTDGAYVAAAKGFALQSAKDHWTLTAGDDVIARAAAGKLGELAQELRGAVLPIADAEFSAHRPAVVWIGGERVRVTSQDERKDAERIIKEARSKYAITFDSIASRRAAREFYGVGGNVTDAGLKATDVEVWDYEELKAFEAAFKHFAPILGDARRTSTRAKKPQETTTVGKLAIASDDDQEKPEARARGEHFDTASTSVLYRPDPDLRKSDPHYFEMHATHELAHGAFAPQIDAFMKATGWWRALRVPSGRGEAPPDSYANTNAAEDIAQSVAYYFVDPDRLKKGDGKHEAGLPGNPCPRRYAFIRNVVGGWTPSKK
jgi:hypothetical protein